MSRKKGGFYAVRHGRTIGIFTDWSDTQTSVTGFSGAEHRKFARKADAEAWLAEGDTQELKRERDQEPVEEPVKKKQCVSVVVPTVTTVYCDGACFGNGTTSATGGVGVWFGTNDARNLSEPLPPSIEGTHTNQKAELWAAIRALQELGEEEAVVICTDSQYTLNAATKWRHNWIRKRWNVALDNMPLLRQLSDLVDARKASTEWRYVPGHTGIEGNEAADQLAKSGCKR